MWISNNSPRKLCDGFFFLSLSTIHNDFNWFWRMNQTVCVWIPVSSLIQMSSITNHFEIELNANSCTWAMCRICLNERKRVNEIYETKRHIREMCNEIIVLNLILIRLFWFCLFFCIVLCVCDLFTAYAINHMCVCLNWAQCIHQTERLPSKKMYTLFVLFWLFRFVNSSWIM